MVAIYSLCYQSNSVIHKYMHYTPSLSCLLSMDPTCVQNLRPVTFEILGFKLKNKNNNDKKNNCRNRPFWHISHVCSPNFRYTYILTLAIILWCQRGIFTESEGVNLNFGMYCHAGPRPCPSLL